MVINCTVTSMHRRDERFFPLNQVKHDYNERLKYQHTHDSGSRGEGEMPIDTKHEHA